MQPPQKRGAQSPPLPVVPDELVFIMLSWLPVKSLMRFRCVSKSWKSLISDPDFVKLHLHKSCTNTDFTHHRLISQISGFRQMHATSYSLPLLLNNPLTPVEPEIEFKGSAVDTYVVVGSCNGLLCVARVSVKERYQQYRVCLWNPSTRFRSDDSPELCVSYGSPVFGFGYDNISDTYKLVAVLYDEVSRRSLVNVFSVGDKRWREIQRFHVILSIMKQNDGVYLSGSGTLNWLALLNVNEASVWRVDKPSTFVPMVIVSLDLAKETSTQLLLPRGLYKGFCFQPTLGVLRDCLCACHDYRQTCFVVWQMKEFGDENSWIQLVNISYQDLQTRSLEYRTMLLPLLLYENGDIMMVSLAKSPATLFKWRDDGLESSEIPKNAMWTRPKLYLESLVLPC